METSEIVVGETYQNIHTGDTTTVDKIDDRGVHVKFFGEDEVWTLKMFAKNWSKEVKDDLHLTLPEFNVPKGYLRK